MDGRRKNNKKKKKKLLEQKRRRVDGAEPDSTHHHHNDQQGGHSENSQQQQSPRHQQSGRNWISSPITSPWPLTLTLLPATATTPSTRTRFFPSSSRLWPDKRGPHRHHAAELPEECFSPATPAFPVSGRENPTLTPTQTPTTTTTTRSRLEHGSHQSEPLCELPAEVPEAPEKTSRRRRSLHDSYLVGLKEDVPAYEEHKGRVKPPVVEKEHPYYASNGDGKGGQGEYVDGEKNDLSPCPSSESGPLGKLEAIEKKGTVDNSKGRPPSGFI